MAKFNVCGTMFVNVEVEVEAETLEEAMDIVSGDVYPESYVNETIGVEYGSDAITSVVVDACGFNNIDWSEEWSEEVE